MFSKSELSTNLTSILFISKYVFPEVRYNEISFFASYLIFQQHEPRICQ